MTSPNGMLGMPTALRAHALIGLSTGYMSDLRERWQDQVDSAGAVSSAAIELSALAEPELGSLLGYFARCPSLPFRYVSVHGPVKERRLPEDALVASLARLPTAVRSIVMHPDTIDDPRPYEGLGSRLVIENMDRRKDDGRTVDELAGVFESLPEAGFCFDIAHAQSIDPSMAIGKELLDTFAPRLRQVHLSSLSDDLRHVPLLEEHDELFSPLLDRCVDVPWILEAFQLPN